jgi:hypothetical protein
MRWDRSCILRWAISTRTATLLSKDDPTRGPSARLGGLRSSTSTTRSRMTFSGVKVGTTNGEELIYVWKKDIWFVSDPAHEQELEYSSSSSASATSSSSSSSSPSRPKDIFAAFIAGSSTRQHARQELFRRMDSIAKVQQAIAYISGETGRLHYVTLQHGRHDGLLRSAPSILCL